MLPVSWSALTPELLLIAVLVPMAVAVGFACGVLYERWYHARRLSRLATRLEKLFEYATGILTQAEQVCQRLQQPESQQQLTPPQRSRLSTISSQLMQQLGELTGLSATGSGSELSPALNASGASRTRSFQSPQVASPSRDERTGLPDAIAYHGYLQALLAALPGTEIHCGVLYVQADQYARLRQRYGTPIANEFVRQIGSQTLRQFRDSDLLFQISDDLLIGVLPDIHRDETERIAQAARRAVRNHHFLHPANNEPVFVTAAFGYALFQAELGAVEHPDQELWRQGQQALQASQKHGRCQLHEITPSGLSRLIAG